MFGTSPSQSYVAPKGARILGMVPVLYTFGPYGAARCAPRLRRITHIANEVKAKMIATVKTMIPRLIHSTPIQSKSSIAARVSGGILLTSCCTPK